MMIISQICTVLAYLLFYIAMFSKNKGRLLLLQAVGNIFFALGYIFLFNYTTFTLGLFAVFRFVVFYYLNHAKNPKQEHFVAFLFCIAYCMIASMTATSLVDLFSLYSSLAMTVAIAFSNLITLKSIFISSAVSYILLAIFTGNYASIIGEGIMIGIEITSIVGALKNTVATKS